MRDSLNQKNIKKLSKYSYRIFFQYYENGDKGDYKVTIGYAVLESTKIPEGLTKEILPTRNYKIYHPKSSVPEDIIAMWQIIWSANAKELPCNFIADCEIYSEKFGCYLHRNTLGCCPSLCSNDFNFVRIEL